MRSCSFNTHVMVYRKDGSVLRVRRQLWLEYVEAKRKRRKAPELRGQVVRKAPELRG